MKKYALSISILLFVPATHAMEGPAPFTPEAFLQAVQGNTRTSNSKPLAYFLEHGADVDGAFTRLDGKKPIQQAVTHKHDDGIRLLRLHGASLTRTRDEQGMGVFHWAVLEPSHILKLLVTCPSSPLVWSTEPSSEEIQEYQLGQWEAGIVARMALPVQKALWQLASTSRAPSCNLEELVAANKQRHIELVQAALKETNQGGLRPKEYAKSKNPTIAPLLDPDQVQQNYGEAIKQGYEQYFSS